MERSIAGPTTSIGEDGRYMKQLLLVVLACCVIYGWVCKRDPDTDGGNAGNAENETCVKEPPHTTNKRIIFLTDETFVTQ